MPNFDPAQNIDEVLPSDLITNDRFGVGAQQSFDALSASRYAPPGQIPLDVTTAAAPIPNIQQGGTFSGVPVVGTPPTAPVLPALPPTAPPVAVAPAPAPVVPAGAPPAPAAPPTPHQVRVPGPGGGATPAATTSAPLTAFDAAAKKEQNALDASGVADQATKDQLAGQTRDNNIDRLADIQKQQDDRAAQQIKIDAAQKAANTPYHEFQLSTGRTIIAALGQILGGFSYDPHHVNQAIGVYQDAIKQDFAKQQADHETLFKTAQAAVEQGRQLSADQLAEMKEYEITRAEKLQAILAKGEALAAFSKNELGKATLDKTNVGLRQSLDDAAQNAARLGRAQAETERHNRATEGIERTKAAAEVTKANAANGGKEDIAADREIEQISKKFSNAKKIETDLDEAKKASALLHSGNPTEIQLGKDSLIRAATGGKITKYTDVAGMKATGGISTQIANALESLESGKPSTTAVKVLTDAADHQIKTLTTHAQAVNKAFDSNVRANPVIGKIAKTREPGWLDGYSRSHAPVGIGEESQAPAPAAGPAEGTQSVDSKGRNVVFRGGKWGPA